METQATTRLLLALWDLGGVKQEVRKGELTKRIVSKTKKIADYQSIFNKLQQQGAIAISKTGFTMVSPKGLEVLGEGLKSPNFKFEGTIIGTWTANALIKWINQTNSVVSSQVVSTNGVKSSTSDVSQSILSYKEFQLVVLKVYEQLNRDYNLNHLVPIYRIRREISDRINRSDFNEWLLEMQADDILQLMAGEMRDITPDKREDSITVPGGGLRYYAKLLNS
jgi:hypothetical protein